MQANEDPGSRHHIFPTIDVSNGDLHVAWYDFRNSVTPANEALDVYYASSNTAGVPYPTFSHNERVTDVSHNGNCLIFGGGTAAFHGDYNELDARYDAKLYNTEAKVAQLIQVDWRWYNERKDDIDARVARILRG